MMDSFYIAWRYIRYNRIKTLIIVACISLITFVPIALQLLLNESERQLMSRAVDTPLILGARGSALDLVMNSLYFDDEMPKIISMQSAQDVADTNLALPVPLYSRFKARGFPVIGTTIDYLDFRGLEVAEGRRMAVLGDAVIGSGVAEELGLSAGDSIVTSPENLFDLAGVYPLKMQIVGVLERSFTPDDLGIFTDLKTSWVIQGLGHGHQDLSKTRDSSVILERADDKIVANAKLMQYAEITDDNIDSFHFHGNLDAYPVSAVIAVPFDGKSGTILRGRYLEHEQYQMVNPRQVIDGLLENIFRIKEMLDSVIALVTATTILAILLVFSLSLRLRDREMQTIFKLGCSRMTVARLLVAEIVLIGILSALVSGALLLLTHQYSNELVRALIIS
jgi:putative ABC transport system permease protein